MIAISMQFMSEESMFAKLIRITLLRFLILSFISFVLDRLATRGGPQKEKERKERDCGRLR